MKLRILDVTNRIGSMTLLLGLPDVKPTGENWYHGAWTDITASVDKEYVVASLEIVFGEEIFLHPDNKFCSKANIFDNQLTLLWVSQFNTEKHFPIQLGRIIEVEPMTMNVKSVYSISDLARVIKYVD